MALANYTELKAAVTRAIKRSDMSTDIDDWIVLREAELNLVLRRREMSNRATTTTVVGQAAYALPTDFGDAISMHLNDGDRQVVLSPSDFDRIRTGWTEQGEPEEWAITNNEFLLGPTPDAVYTLELHYYQGITSLLTTSSNWLLDRHPGIYFWGTLVSGASYLGDPQAEAWAMSYQNALRLMLKDQVKERGFGGGPLLRTDIFGGSPVSIFSGE
jgi:hypothetical protein